MPLAQSCPPALSVFGGQEQPGGALQGSGLLLWGSQGPSCGSWGRTGLGVTTEGLHHGQERGNPEAEQRGLTPRASVSPSSKAFFPPPGHRGPPWALVAHATLCSPPPPSSTSTTGAHVMPPWGKPCPARPRKAGIPPKNGEQTAPAPEAPVSHGRPPVRLIPRLPEAARRFGKLCPRRPGAVPKKKSQNKPKKSPLRLGVRMGAGRALGFHPRVAPGPLRRAPGSGARRWHTPGGTKRGRWAPPDAAPGASQGL